MAQPQVNGSSTSQPPTTLSSLNEPSSSSSISSNPANQSSNLPQNSNQSSSSQPQTTNQTPLVNGVQYGSASDPVAPDMTTLFQQRREEEQARKDRSLADFLVMLDGYKPLIPEEITEYYLQKSGFECTDPRLKRLLSLSTQKFISDLSRDAFHFAKLRVNGAAAGRGRPGASNDKGRVVLTMDDLSLALAEHGVNVKKPDYYL